MRKFNSGATRDVVEGKYDLEGFLSPVVLNRYAEYMNKHREQADGKLRDSDNWQKGIPLAVYMKSAYRHFFDWWANHRHVDSVVKEDIEESLCALMFNTMGYLHEYLKDKAGEYNAAEIDGPYVPQSGDVVGIRPRESMGCMGIDGYLERIENANYSGKVAGKLDSPVNIYEVNLAFHVNVNLYLDEIFLLKREG